MADPQLNFVKFTTERCRIFNNNNRYLGEIQRKRVGTFMHWVFTPCPLESLGDIWFTRGTMKELSEKMKDLYRVGRMQ